MSYEEDYLYTGKERDLTGLYYFGARYYDPEVGRFMTRDSVRGDPKNPQSLNLYLYCLNNPLRYIDPLGLEEEEKDLADAVEEIFSHLSNLEKEELEEKLKECKTDEERFKVLKDVVEKLGFECEILEFGTDEGKQYALLIKVDIDGESHDFLLYNDESNPSKYGYAPPNTNEIFINFSKHKTVGELAATICHELCHRVLEITNPELIEKECQQHNYIYPVHVRYINPIAEKAPGAFTDEYVKRHKDMWDFQQTRDCSESERPCMGSTLLSIFIFLEILANIFKRSIDFKT